MDNNTNEYFCNLEQQHNSEAKEGYNYHITIDDTQTIKILGLASVSASIKLSCSHTGENPLGAYKGTIEVNYQADLKGLKFMLGRSASNINSNESGWFKNSNYLMELKAYDKQQQDMFLNTLKKPQQQSDNITNRILNGFKAKAKEFEQNKKPIGLWVDWQYRMSEGNMDSYQKLFAFGNNDNANQNSNNLLYEGAFADHYDARQQSSFPYTISLYDDNNVVFELHSPSGEDITLKFYGKIEKHNLVKSY